MAAEREVLTAVVHPYIVTLQYSFQTSSKLYLMMDFINGGHLFFQLYREVERSRASLFLSVSTFRVFSPFFSLHRFKPPTSSRATLKRSLPGCTKPNLVV